LEEAWPVVMALPLALVVAVELLLERLFELLRMWNLRPAFEPATSRPGPSSGGTRSRTCEKFQRQMMMMTMIMKMKCEKSTYVTPKQIIVCIAAVDEPVLAVRIRRIKVAKALAMVPTPINNCNAVDLEY
jgi:hypothetical protein